MSFAGAALSLLLSVGTLTLFHACDIKEDGTWMHCHDAQNAVVIGGFLLVLLLTAAALIRNKTAGVIFYGLGVIGSVIIFLIPGTIISMCMMQTMRCYTTMQPFVRIFCVLIAICSLIPAIQTAKN